MDSVELISGLAGGGAVGAVITYFTLASKSRQYIREAMGKTPEIEVTVSKQPMEVKAAVIYAEKGETEKRFTDLESKIDDVEIHFDRKIEAARVETKRDLEKMSREAVEGRRLIHAEIRNTGEKTQDRILDLTNVVGELRGEIKGMK